ncbi:DNA-binding response regulator [Niallia circulans]|uniref:DNA-binding response regulator n=1 Tax=Niallia circulans TaxID=1397 RepID=A0A553SMI8_NIACI|nr:response regulator [Niallia circulans]TRZ38187.1 DNA-binding response regulator [Niallia circulans]
MTYKVLLADDERIIVEGISSVIDWSSLNTELVATARNGLDAYEKISACKPDIVISDIKMPGMDGIALAKKVHEEYPATSFILLSGFGEFEYARKAMLYGVKNYLLKPCNEEKITAALQDIIKELEEKKRQKEKFLLLEENLEKIQPFMKAQLLAQLFTGKGDKSDFSRYEHLFAIKDRMQQVMLVLIETEGDIPYEHLSSIVETAGDFLPNLVLQTVIGKHGILIMNAEKGIEDCKTKVTALQKELSFIHCVDMTVAISGPGSVETVKSLYNRALEYIAHKFYVGIGKIITNTDIHPQPSQKCSTQFVMDEQPVCLMIKAGSEDEAHRELNHLFDRMGCERLGIHQTKSYCIQLYKTIIQTVDKDNQLDLHAGTAELLAMKTVQQMKEYLDTVASLLADKNKARLQSKQSSVINKVIDIIESHFANPELSLKNVANEMLYMNPDYLGKLFKQETGERFSAYLTKWRIEKAIAYITDVEDVKMVTLADKIGFGDNPQYFSQVFKKYTGYTPSEYKKALKV